MLATILGLPPSSLLVLFSSPRFSFLLCLLLLLLLLILLLILLLLPLNLLVLREVALGAAHLLSERERQRSAAPRAHLVVDDHAVNDDDDDDDDDVGCGYDGQQELETAGTAMMSTSTATAWAAAMAAAASAGGGAAWGREAATDVAGALAATAAARTPEKDSSWRRPRLLPLRQLPSSWLNLNAHRSDVSSAGKWLTVLVGWRAEVFHYGERRSYTRRAPRRYPLHHFSFFCGRDGGGGIFLCLSMSP